MIKKIQLKYVVNKLVAPMAVVAKDAKQESAVAPVAKMVVAMTLITAATLDPSKVSCCLPPLIILL